MYFLLTLFAIFIVLYFFGKDLRHRWFAFLMNKFTQSKDAKYEDLKKDFFKPIHSAVSHNPELRKEKKLCVLEIGVGTGVNFEYYPDGTHLIVVDPNPHFRKYYNENRSKFTNIQSEEIIVTTGEEMDMVESNSVDVVVVTLVMCSAADIPGLLKQINRVLAPGGKFLFFEHVCEFSDNHSTRLTIQNVLSTTRIWPFLFDGCYLNRDPLEDIKSSGFSHVESNRVHAPINSWFFSVIAPHLMGVACK